MVHKKYFNLVNVFLFYNSGFKLMAPQFAFLHHVYFLYPCVMFQMLFQHVDIEGSNYSECFSLID